MTNKQKIIVTTILVLLAGIGIGFGISNFTQKQTNKSEDKPALNTAESKDTKNTVEVSKTSVTPASDVSNISTVASTIKTYNNQLFPDFSLQYDTVPLIIKEKSDRNFPVLSFFTKDESYLDVTFGPGEGYGGSGISCFTEENYKKLDGNWIRVNQGLNVYTYYNISTQNQNSNVAFKGTTAFDKMRKDYTDAFDASLNPNDVVCVTATSELIPTKTTIMQNTVNAKNKNISIITIQATLSSDKQIYPTQFDDVVKTIKY